MVSTKSKHPSASAPSTQAPAPALAVAATTSTAGPSPSPQATQATPSATPTPPVTGVANGSNTGTKTDLQTSYVALISGLAALFQPSELLVVQTGAKTRDALIADFQQFVQAAENTKACYQAYRDAVQAERTIEASVRPERQGVRKIAEARFGVGGTQLLKLGFMPRRASSKTALSKAVAVVKTQATRAARGTKGSKQKLAISGNVTSVILTPVTAPGAGPHPVTPPATAPEPVANNGSAPATASTAPAGKPATATS